jgi:hypothetical protein
MGLAQPRASGAMCSRVGYGHCNGAVAGMQRFRATISVLFFAVLVAAQAAHAEKRAAALPGVNVADIEGRISTKPGLARTRLAQAGSTGGTLGKTDQSLSGDQSKQARPEKAPGPLGSQGAAKARVLSVAGQWNWVAQCGGISTGASLVLEQSSATNFTGRFTGSNTWGTIVNGRLQGDQVSFDRVGGPLGLSERWTARLNGPGQMHGSSSGAIECMFTARKY